MCKRQNCGLTPAEIVWCDDAPPLSVSTAYRFALRRESNDKLIISLAYEYSN